MKITFVGTSRAVPTKERYCSCIMLEVGKSIYYIDAGAPVIDTLLRAEKNINDFRAMFTTHAHSDHTYGLLPLSELMHWYYTDSSADFYLTDAAQMDAVTRLSIASGTPRDEKRVRFHLAHEGCVYEDGNIKVEYIPTMHTSCSYAILVTEKDKRVLFGGDLSANLAKNDIPRITEESIDAFVCEMAHFGAQQIKPYLDRCHAAKVFFTHVWPLSKYGDIQAMKEQYSFEILTPDDGDSFEI